MNNFTNDYSWRRWGFCVFPIVAIFSFGVTNAVAEEAMSMEVYDEAAYTEYVESTMKELDKLYLELCDTCGVEATSAAKSRNEFLGTVRDR